MLLRSEEEGEWEKLCPGLLLEGLNKRAVVSGLDAGAALALPSPCAGFFPAHSDMHLGVRVLAVLLGLSGWWVLTGYLLLRSVVWGVLWAGLCCQEELIHLWRQQLGSRVPGCWQQPWINGPYRDETACTQELELKTWVWVAGLKVWMFLIWWRKSIILGDLWVWGFSMICQEPWRSAPHSWKPVAVLKPRERSESWLHVTSKLKKIVLRKRDVSWDRDTCSWIKCEGLQSDDLYMEEQTTSGRLLPVCSWECEVEQVMAVTVRDTLLRCKAQDEHQAPNIFLENREFL